MNKVLLIGCGKMGSLLKKRLNNMIVGIVEKDYININSSPNIIIDFSNPKMLNRTIEYAKKYNAKLIIGTTGYNELEMAQIKELSKSNAVVYSANYSYGIAFIESIIDNPLLARYNKKINEYHDSSKLDLPSGTSIELAKKLNTSYICSYREENSKLMHEIVISNQNEIMVLSHKAIDRGAYVDGVLDVIEWIIKKENGFYSFLDFIKDGVRYYENIFKD